MLGEGELDANKKKRERALEARLEKEYGAYKKFLDDAHEHYKKAEKAIRQAAAEEEAKEQENARRKSEAARMANEAKPFRLEDLLEDLPQQQRPYVMAAINALRRGLEPGHWFKLPEDFDGDKTSKAKKPNTPSTRSETPAERAAARVVAEAIGEADITMAAMSIEDSDDEEASTRPAFAERLTAVAHIFGCADPPAPAPTPPPTLPATTENVMNYRQQEQELLNQLNTLQAQRSAHEEQLAEERRRLEVVEERRQQEAVERRRQAEALEAQRRKEEQEAEKRRQDEERARLITDHLINMGPPTIEDPDDEDDQFHPAAEE